MLQISTEGGLILAIKSIRHFSWLNPEQAFSVCSDNFVGISDVLGRCEFWIPNLVYSIIDLRAQIWRAPFHISYTRPIIRYTGEWVFFWFGRREGSLLWLSQVACCVLQKNIGRDILSSIMREIPLEHNDGQTRWREGPSLHCRCWCFARWDYLITY